jgi:hypothetical protein
MLEIDLVLVDIQRFVALLCLLIAPQMTWAEFYRASKIKDGLEKWEAPGTPGGSFEAGYVIGVFDVISGVNVCAPNGVTVGQVTAVVLKYMRENPQSLHLFGDAVIRTALINTWPCTPVAPSAPARPKPAPAPRDRSPF